MVGDRDGPYVGPRPFEREDQSLFFGRDREAAALASLIIAHPVVLLYAQSGAGKSSLLNAEVAPRLETRGYEVFATMRVGGDLPSGVAPSDVPNIYVFNALISLEQWRSGSALQRPSSIREYLRSKPYPSTTTGGASIRILIFDQFEEVFTSFPERWKDRDGFFEEVGAALEEDPRLRVIFAMREEFIGGMDTYAARLPERLRTRFRLERLGAEAALLAVTKPLETTERTFKPQAARKLFDNLLKVPIKSVAGVTDVSGEYVEPLHLQLVCTKLWKSLPPDVKLIDEKYIEDLGDVDQALAAYYESCVTQVVTDAGVDEGTLRAWFERTLITADGVRGIVPKGAESTGGLSNDVLDRLQKLYLIRTEMRGLNPWYELTHDRFVAPIRRCNELWRNAVGAGKLVTLELEAKADHWARAGKQRTELLGGAELARTKELLASPALKAFGISEGVKEYVQASQIAEERRHRLRISFGVTFAVAFAVGVYLWRAHVAKTNAEDATSIAQADVAKKFADKQGLEFEAVAYGMRAVHPRLEEKRDPPAEAVEGLRAALTAVGPDTWLRGFSGQVTDVGISADGKHAVARSQDAICAWDAVTGRPLFKCLPRPKEGSEPDFFFSPDRKWIYKLGRAGIDDTAQMWNARTGELAFVSELTGTRDISFSRDGAWAAAYGPSTEIRVIDLATEKISTPFQRPSGDLAGVAIAPKGDLIALVSMEGGVELWNRKSGKALPSSGNGQTYTYVIFSPDARRIAVTSVDFTSNQARSTVWSITEETPVSKSASIELDLPPGSSFTLEFSPDSMTVTTLTTASAKVWNAVSGAMIGDEYVLADGATAKLLDDGRVIVRKGEGDTTTLAVVDPLSSKSLVQRVIPGEVVNEDVASDYTRFVSVGKNNFVRVYKATEEPMKLADLSAKDLFAMACEKLRDQQEFFSLEPKIQGKCKGTEQYRPVGKEL